MTTDGLKARWSKRSMRTRIVGATVATLTAVLAVLGTYFIVLQRDMMREQMNAERKRMYDELGQKALALTTNVALASERALVVKDFLFLTQIVSSTQGSVPQCAYGALMDKGGRARVHTDTRFAGTALGAPDDVAARAITTPMVRLTDYAGKQVMEAVAPVKMGDERWGVARFGFYLDSLNDEVASSEKNIEQRVYHAIFTTVVILGVVIAAGIVIGTLGARALTQPLASLLTAVQNLREGTSEQAVAIHGSPELTALAEGFNEMSLAVRKREDALRTALATADEASRLKSEFLANISHELRTPLNAIINVPNALLGDFRVVLAWLCPGCNKMYEPDEGQAMQEDTESCPSCSTELKVIQRTEFVGEPETHRHFNQRALSSAQHLLRVVNDLLDFSRLQARKTELALDEVSVGDFVGDIQATMQNLAEAKHIEVKFAVPPENTPMLIDRVKMGQVLINLLGNAIKFTPERGAVTLTARVGYEGDDSLMHFAVQDTGIGIPQNQLKTIFEPFRQVDGSHTRSFGGSGLGLTITAQLVQLHGGRVWADSVLGNGSTFHIVMPRRAHVAEATLPVEHHRGILLPDQPTRRVVVLDDDETYLQITRHMLQKVGFEVTVLNEPGTAVATIEQLRPDLLIVDIMMPHLSGIEVVRHLRSTEMGRTLPIIVSTAYRANEGVVGQLGAKWLPKPWNAEQLLDCLKTREFFPLLLSAPSATAARTTSRV